MEDLLYEAHTLVSAAKTRVKQYQSLKDQLEEVKKACKGVVDLDQAFQGKGADAIKDFYEAQLDVMDGWLDFIDVQIAFLQRIEGDMEEADLGEGTVVSTSFVDHEVTNKLNQSKEMVAQQKEDIQNILSNIEDLVDLKLYSTQSFEEKIEKAEKEKKETVQQVGELDQQWLHEYAVSEKNQGLVINLYRELMNATTKGGVASPMYFDEKAYHRSDIYQVKDEVDQATEVYIKTKEEQAEVRDLKEKAEEEANKPWYEKTWDGIATFTGEFTGYYDYKRTKEGIDPITGEKLSEADRVKAAAMAAAGFIPLIGWAGKAFKGGKAIYKTTKGINAASHALDTYKTTKTFDILQKTEMGIYGLASANGFGEYITGYDMFGNKLTEEQRQASFVQGLLGLGAGYITVKGADGVTKDATNLATDFKNVGKDIQTKGGQILEDTSRALKLDRTDNFIFVGAQGITRSNAADTVQHVSKDELMMKAEGVGGVTKGAGNKIDSDTIKKYIRDIEGRTGRELPKNQIEKLKEALRNKEYKKLSPIETAKHRAIFDKVKNKVIKEWEENTGQKWPVYNENVISEKTGKIIRKHGDKYDAHHIIENTFGGEHEWWNMHPAKFPNEHQAGIHGTGSPANTLFKGR